MDIYIYQKYQGFYDESLWYIKYMWDISKTFHILQLTFKCLRQVFKLRRNSKNFQISKVSKFFQIFQNTLKISTQKCYDIFPGVNQDNQWTTPNKTKQDQN